MINFKYIYIYKASQSHSNDRLTSLNEFLQYERPHINANLRANEDYLYRLLINITCFVIVVNK